MTQVTVRGRDRIRRWELSAWDALVALAAVSADPETLEEWFDAVRRYLPNHDWAESGIELPAINPDPPASDGWCLIDLVGRTVVAGGDFELPDRRGAYQADDDDPCDGFHIVWLDTPDDWVWRQTGRDWYCELEARATAALHRTRSCARAVLLGPPLVQYLAQEVLATDARGRLGKEARYAATRRIHATWLMTPRDDLGGKTPRNLLLADRERISLDIEHRSQQWSMQRWAPPGLADDSFAYRFGGFGMTEVVLYFAMIRALLAEAWDYVAAHPAIGPEAWIAHLAQYRDRWLDSPHEESAAHETRRHLIESERRRTPIAADGSHRFDDCPICQAQADSDFGPAFMFFDGHHLELEDEFAFSLTESREEWEQEQAEYRDWSDALDRKMAAKAGSDEEEEWSSSVWKSSYVDWDAVTQGSGPLSGRFALAFPLAELISDLQRRPDAQRHVGALNAAYGDFRRADSELIARSAAERLCEELESLAASFPDLVGKSAELQSRLHEVVRGESGVGFEP